MSIYKKLLEVQKEIKPIKKDQKNPHFKNSYFDINALLDAVKPALNKHGLLLMQPLQGETLVTIIVDTENDESKVFFEARLPSVQDPQKYGGVITYFRRYALTALLALEAEDDDGNTASNVANEWSSYSNKQTTDPTSKLCDTCNKEHTGPYKTCYQCYKNKQGSTIN